MSKVRKSGLQCLSVYVNDDRIVKRLQKAATLENRTLSNFIALAAEQVANEVIEREERKEIAAERQLRA